MWILSGVIILALSTFQIEYDVYLQGKLQVSGDKKLGFRNGLVVFNLPSPFSESLGEHWCVNSKIQVLSIKRACVFPKRELWSFIDRFWKTKKNQKIIRKEIERVFRKCSQSQELLVPCLESELLESIYLHQESQKSIDYLKKVCLQAWRFIFQITRWIQLFLEGCFKKNSMFRSHWFWNKKQVK